MKRILNFLSAWVLVLFLVTACDITEYNPGGMTDETVYSSPEGYEGLVTAAYSYQRWWYGKDYGHTLSSLSGDILSSHHSWQSGIARFQDLQPTNNNIELSWEELYKGINACNAGIERAGESGLSESLQATRKAELRFLRAHYYWLLVEQWGGVHLTTEETEGIEVTATRSSVGEIYDQIFEDLNFAIENLPPNTPDYGRATKPAAEAFAARMHLTRGNDQEAYDLAKTVIDDYNFDLVEDYDDLWDMENQQNEEVVYAVHYSEDLSHNDASSSVYPEGHSRGSNNLHLYYVMFYQLYPGMVADIENGTHFNRYHPNRSFMDLFDEEVDSRYDASFKEVWYANVDAPDQGIAVGDTAIYATKKELSEDFREGKNYVIRDANDLYNPDGTIVNSNIFVNFYGKFKDPTRDPDNAAQSSRDVFVIRLAEMYMIAAEAQHNLGNNSLAADYINILRERAAYPGNEQEMNVTPADIDIDFILDERARELAGENLRFFDLKRTDKLEERIEQNAPLVRQYFQPHHKLRPIPQGYLDALENPEEFRQNPGYN